MWAEVPEFPDYLVSSRGLIVNDRTGRVMQLSRNQHGVYHVGMMKGGKQHKRAIAPIVALAFLGRHHDPRFTTPMHLNGNQEHNFVENLVWRPRPFVHSYYAQLRDSYRNRITRPIMCNDTREIFADSLQAAMRYGLLERAVVLSVLNPGEGVFPEDLTFSLAPL